MSREAMKLALEALEADPLEMVADANGHMVFLKDQAITAIKEALALAEQTAQQEPAGWRPATFHRDNLTFNPGFPDEQTVKFWKLQGVEIEYCYTTPQPAQRTWVGLTEKRIKEIWLNGKDHGDNWRDVLALARSFEAELKGLNT